MRAAPSRKAFCNKHAAHRCVRERLADSSTRIAKPLYAPKECRGFESLRLRQPSLLRSFGWQAILSAKDARRSFSEGGRLSVRFAGLPPVLEHDEFKLKWIASVIARRRSRRSNPVGICRSGLLRGVCHRAGHYGPDPLARNDGGFRCVLIQSNPVPLYARSRMPFEA